MIHALSRSSYRHPWRTLVLWLVVLAGLVAASGALGTRFSDGGRLRGSDSDAAYQLLARDLPSSGAPTAQVVIHHALGLTDPSTTATVSGLLGRIAALPNAGAVGRPLVSPDGTTEVVEVEMPEFSRLTSDGQHVADVLAREIEREAAGARSSGVQVELGGEWFATGDVPASAEGLGLIVAVIVLLALFASLIVVGVALMPALIAVTASGAVVTLVSRLIATPDVTTTVATMIGLGVGIDYGLVIITRFRRELAVREPHDALRVTMATAGRAVALAAGTVAVSLLGMLLIGLEFLHGLSVGAAVAVGVAVLSSLTLLPALLRWSTPSLIRKATRLAAKPARETMWHRWGRGVAAHPVAALLGGLAVLGVLAAPVASMRLAGADAGNDPAGTTTRVAYDLVAEAFGPGVNGPLVVAVDQATTSSVDALTAQLMGTPGVASVQPAAWSDRAPTAVITVIPTTAPQSEATEALVARLRHDVIPASGATAHVGGATASNVDFAQVLRDRLPLFIGGVLASSFVLLMVVFRSLLVPLKAVLLNLLSIGAAFGAMVVAFQWRDGAPIEPWAPMLLFAIVFGLSMDYEVFLLSAVKEHWDATGDNREAVVEGLSSTARVITGAAAIMVAVFGGFLTADLHAVRMIGFGLAFAVLVDATVVRMLLVPASMELLGNRNWWLPRFIGARLPQVQLEMSTR